MLNVELKKIMKMDILQNYGITSWVIFQEIECNISLRMKFSQHSFFFILITALNALKKSLLREIRNESFEMGDY
jgi:hypothetical protein